MNVREIVETTLKDTQDGKSADLCAKIILCNLIDNEPFQAVELNSLEELLLMMKGADFPHVYGERGVFYFSAYYYHDESYPVGRNYFVKRQDLLSVAKLHKYFRDNDLSLPMISYLDIKDKIREKGYQSRISAFKKTQDERTKYVRGLFSGRKESVGVEKCMFLSTDGCLVCGQPAPRMMTSTFSAENGFMLGFNLCDKHMSYALDEQSLTHYIAKVFKQPEPQNLVNLNPEALFSLVVTSAKDRFDCEVESAKKSTLTITMVRKSNFRIIIRITNPNNYAYMIQSDQKLELCRVDSANHHKVDYGPDHLHPDLVGDKSLVKSSFTTGNPLVDAKTIIKLVEYYEKTKANKAFKSDS
ncbi:TPA: hypothetical protein ACN30S_005015 [Vibrio campbellii]